MSSASQEVLIIEKDVVLETLKRCQGYYKCPEAPEGKLLGPLVGYVGRYDDGQGNMKQYVGKVYYNFARAEQYPHVLEHFARGLAHRLAQTVAFDLVVGTPMGGILIAGDVSRLTDSRRIFCEKKTVAPDSAAGREVTKLVVERHEIRHGDRVVVCEDLVNNLSTTEQVKALIEEHGGTLVAIACVLNRSPHCYFSAADAREIPIVSLLHLPTEQFRQDDPKVAFYIEAGQVLWKPKHRWAELKAAMDVAGQ